MTRRVPILNLPAQYKQIGPQLEKAVLEVLRSGNYVLGEQLKQLEREVAEICGTRYGVGVGNGTDALILSLWCLDIGPGDEVITTPFTFAATIEAIVIRGATPVFVDIDPQTFNIDPRLIERTITPKTKILMPVHLYGLPADMDPILKLAEKYGLKVIEDNAQAIGATYRGKATGGMGDLACISFYPTKNLGACGDAGMLVTGNEKLADRLRRLRAHGMYRRYFHDELGMNSRLDEIQAVALRAKLPYLFQWNQRRAELAALYSQALKNCPGITLPLATIPGSTNADIMHVWHQYTIRVHSNSLKEHNYSRHTSTSKKQSKFDIENNQRSELICRLSERGIGSMCYYPVPLHLQCAFENLGYKQGDFPISEAIAREVLSLPMYPELGDEDVLFVAESIQEIMAKQTAGFTSNTFAPTLPTI